MKPSAPSTINDDHIHTPMANALRILAMDAVEAAASGHPGMPMGMADVATVLWRHILRVDPNSPGWPDRDRLVLSAGHGSMLLYAASYLLGYQGMTLGEIKNFRQLGSRTPGHPEHDIGIGVETTTGPLGQGIANAVGMALAERIMNARFGDDLVDHHTFVIASDGDLMEGISHEAASLAGHLKLGRLIVFYDDNKISIDGPTSLSFSDDTLARFAAYGWHVSSIDGHDPFAIQAAAESARSVKDRPSLIACRTTIGFGSPAKAGTKDCHGSPLGKDEVAATRKKLGWTSAPFEIPDAILKAWRELGERGRMLHDAWRLRYLESNKRDEFDAALNGVIPNEASSALRNICESASSDRPKISTRQASGQVLEAIYKLLPSLVGGSADLTPSNNTYANGMTAISPPHYHGSYIHFGVREHAMAAAMNGMALHGGVIPYGGTFLQFSDYARPAIRLAALMGQRVIFVMTHDSIGLGEDGPTHQPVEHLAALRAIPNLLVFRPCDAIETAECWDLALRDLSHPSLLALSRQSLPTIRDASPTNLCARGGYVLIEPPQHRDITLIATGSEVSLAIEAKDILAHNGIAAAVVSLPCMKLFLRQNEKWRREVLGNAPRIVIEAGISQGWEGIIGDNGVFIGMKTFGASAPAGNLFKHFGITSEAIVRTAKDILSVH